LQNKEKTVSTTTQLNVSEDDNSDEQHLIMASQALNSHELNEYLAH
jgi:hypothetical protein